MNLRIGTSLTVVILVTAALAAAAPASAASSYCSPSGDLCYGALAERPPVRLQITLMAEYFKRYRLCVTDPGGRRECKRFSVRPRSNGTYESTVRWSRHFSNGGRGTYRVRWSTGGRNLGPAVTFRR